MAGVDVALDLTDALILVPVVILREVEASKHLGLAFWILVASCVLEWCSMISGSALNAATEQCRI